MHRHCQEDSTARRRNSKAEGLDCGNAKPPKAKSKERSLGAASNPTARFRGWALVPMDSIQRQSQTQMDSHQTSKAVASSKRKRAQHFGRPRLVDCLRSGVQDQPGQHGETPYLLKLQKLAQCGGTHLYFQLLGRLRHESYSNPGVWFQSSILSPGSILNSPGAISTTLLALLYIPEHKTEPSPSTTKIRKQGVTSYSDLKSPSWPVV
ncbi:Zinc finger protein 714, partial [Plecturocebus cupreus]